MQRLWTWFGVSLSVHRKHRSPAPARPRAAGQLPTCLKGQSQPLYEPAERLHKAARVVKRDRMSAFLDGYEPAVRNRRDHALCELGAQDVAVCASHEQSWRRDV